MSNRAVTVSLLGIMVALFIIYFVVLNTTILSEQPIEKHLNNIIEYVRQEEWSKAEKSVQLLESAWNRIKFPIALNYAEADYSMFMEFVGRTRSAIESRDASQAASDASAALEIWDNFVKVIPQP